MKRTDKTSKTVVNDVATKKKYVSPEIEVFNLDYQPQLLAQSPVGATLDGVCRDLWDDDDD